MSSSNKGVINNVEMAAVAIDKDKGSQYALKWAVDNLLGKGKSVTLLHVRQKQSSAPTTCMHACMHSYCNTFKYH